MNIHTDPGNFQTVKIIIASNISGTQLKFVERKHEDKVVPYLSHNVLPVLEVYPNKFLFSPNSAVRYLLPEDDIIVEQWLEWESSQLQPVLFPYLLAAVGHNKVETDLLNRITKITQSISTLELKGKQYLSKVGLSSADVVVWSSLYPILTPGKGCIKDWEKQYPNIKSWFEALSQTQPFQSGLDFVYKGSGTDALKSSLLAQRPSLQLPKDQVKMQSTEAAKKVSKPSKAADTTQAEEQQSVPEKAVTPEELKAAANAWKTGKCLKPVERVHPILPQEGKRNIMITSALPYVNNVPHLGNIIGCVLSADVFSRFCRLMNYNCLYICGTDEYGTATETKAIEEGLTPKQICDKYNKIHQEIYKWFNIDFDFFGRTTTSQQTSISQDIFWKLYKRNYIMKDSIEQLKCDKCDRFLADRFVEGTCPLCSYDDARGDQCDACGKLINAIDLKQPKCKLCKSSPSVKATQHLFLDLPKIEPELKAHLDNVFSTGTWTNNSKVITSSWIRDGLKPRCISRDLKWGTPVPLEGYTDKVFYVWFDAPIGYISITANYTDKWEQWWKNPKQVEMYNFLGKDNVPFHSVIFPCTLLGADDNFSIVNHMIATEYLNYEDGKFSKSRGSGIFGDHAKDTGIPADIYRFYLLFVRPESQDSAFSWDDFLLKNNSELLNNLGNFINRALMFVSNNFKGEIQKMVLNDDDNQLLALINRELHAYLDNMKDAKLRDALKIVLNISRLGNQFMQANKPWVLVKGSETEKARAGTVVSLSANIACLLSVLLQPFMPVTKLKKKFHGKPAPVPAKGGSKNAKETALNGPVSAEAVAKLTEEVAKQGNVVRELKAKKAEKSLIDAEVAKLLDLKKKLAAAEGKDPNADSGSSKKKVKKSEAAKPSSGVSKPVAETGGAQDSQEEIDRLTNEVTKQGNKVRDLKTNKSEKSVIDAEVAKLLDLKKQLAVAQGQDPEAITGGGKKKGKKK
ncbi:hypothetical protein KUTeg_015404 [Tegillarca granosa]|uniref:Methionine--tRNA ligase, cytoplasmic n=1 Tax=Tegillarca granosa TaxID=220873 RepID=A0ABQ9EV96_TEGGR|nr:hypothetical protein KUTeg_015404 [Tegillarca granosa]